MAAVKSPGTRSGLEQAVPQVAMKDRTASAGAQWTASQEFEAVYRPWIGIGQGSVGHDCTMMGTAVITLVPDRKRTT